MRKYFLLFMFMLQCLLVFSQEEASEMPVEIHELTGRSPGLYGRVIEGQTSKGIAAAAVQVYISKKDSGTGTQKDSLVTGTCATSA